MINFDDYEDISVWLNGEFSIDNNIETDEEISVTKMMIMNDQVTILFHPIQI